MVLWLSLLFIQAFTVIGAITVYNSSKPHYDSYLQMSNRLEARKDDVFTYNDVEYKPECIEPLKVLFRASTDAKESDMNLFYIAIRTFIIIFIIQMALFVMHIRSIKEKK